MTEIPFHPAARAEAVAASLYLESERIGYGEKFEDEIDALLARIQEVPKRGQRLPDYLEILDVRAVPMSMFRYSLLVASPGHLQRCRSPRERIVAEPGVDCRDHAEDHQRDHQEPHISDAAGLRPRPGPFLGVDHHHLDHRLHPRRR